MKPQRFHGTTSREVLRKVKQALGEDALIVTNRATDGGGIEITALPGRRSTSRCAPRCAEPRRNANACGNACRDRTAASPARQVGRWPRTASCSSWRS
jgi:flagellar biosynthesis protein FlhF